MRRIKEKKNVFVYGLVKCKFNVLVDVMVVWIGMEYIVFRGCKNLSVKYFF